MYRTNENAYEICVDESGRGSLAFPVFVGAVVLKPGIPVPSELNDSKKLSKPRKRILRQWIEKNALYWTVKSVDNRRIDEINILRATFEGMKSAIDDLIQKMAPQQPDLVLIDGDKYDRSVSYKYECIVGGDGRYAGIAAASILAKEYHDEYVRQMIKEEPILDVMYDFSSNMAYGSPRHLEGLKKYGPSDYHRLSFGCCTDGTVKKQKWSLSQYE